MRTIAFFLVYGIAAAQSPEAGRIVHRGDEAKLMVDSGRPLDSAAITLSEQAGVLVNVEDPLYLYKDDVKDVTGEVSRAPQPSLGVLVPRGGPMEVSFRTGPDGKPEDVRALLESLRQAANARFPFAFRLDEDEGSWTFVPTRTRDVEGRRTQVAPLLDRRVTIASGTRMVREHVNLLMEDLSKQTGAHVSCCQAGIAGVPWGMESILFEAHDEPARHVLLRLIRATRGQYYWLMRCDPGGGSCFINLQLQRSQ
jgi:hypothetical protein